MFLTDIQRRDVAIIITVVVVLVAVVSITYEPTYVWWERPLLNYASNAYILLALILVFFQNSIWKRNLKILFMVSLFVILVLVDVMETVYVQHKYPDLLTALKNIDDYKWLIVLQFFIFVGIGYVFMTRKLIFIDIHRMYRFKYDIATNILMDSLDDKEKKYFEKIRQEKIYLNGNDNDFYAYYSYDMFNALPQFKKDCIIKHYKDLDSKGERNNETEREFHKTIIIDAISSLNSCKPPLKKLISVKL